MKEEVEGVRADNARLVEEMRAQNELEEANFAQIKEAEETVLR